MEEDVGQGSGGSVNHRSFNLWVDSRIACGGLEENASYRGDEDICSAPFRERVMHSYSIRSDGKHSRARRGVAPKSGPHESRPYHQGRLRFSCSKRCGSGRADDR